MNTPAQTPIPTNTNNTISNPKSTSPSNEIAELAKLRQKLAGAQLPPDLTEKANIMIDRAGLNVKYGGLLSGFEQVAKYIDWITVCILPFILRNIVILFRAIIIIDINLSVVRNFWRHILK